MHKSIGRHRRDELVFFDPQNPRAIVNLLPEPLARRLTEAWRSEDQKLFGMTEQRLRGELIRRGKCPTATDTRLRLQLWLEYDRFQNEADPTHKELNMAYVIGFAMGKEAFYTHYIQDNCALAWLFCPPVEYQQALEEVMRESMERLREAINSDIVRAGVANGRVLNFLLKTDQVLFQRWAALNKKSVMPLEDKEPELPEGLSPEDLAADQAEVERLARKKRIEELQKQADAKAKADGTGAP